MLPPDKSPQPLLKYAAILLLTLAWTHLAPGADIFDSIKGRDLETVRLLLKNNPDLVSTNDALGMTPLHWAVRYHGKEMVKLLLANKANIEATDKLGRTPLQWAALAGGKEVAEILVRSNANLNAAGRTGSTPLMLAVSYGNKDIAELLLKNNASVDLKDTYGHSALRIAVIKSRIDIVELLLSCNADVNTRDNYGITPLAQASRTDVAKLLLANKADVNAADKLTGRTPLHCAAYVGSRDMSELLIASNADVNARDNRGATPLQTAVERGSKAVVELLLASHANVNATDTNGNTPFQFGFHNKDIADLLRQHGGHGRKITTGPLAGWYLDGDADSEHDQKIVDDYQAYAHKIFPKDRDFFFSEVDFYEDGTGKHAVKIQLEPDLRYYVEYYLIYDAKNVRTKVIKGKTWHEFHI